SAEPTSSTPVKSLTSRLSWATFPEPRTTSWPRKVRLQAEESRAITSRVITVIFFIVFSPERKVLNSYDCEVLWSLFPRQDSLFRIFEQFISRLCPYHSALVTPAPHATGQSAPD